MKKAKTWLSNFMSIDEQKTSALIFGFIACLIFFMVMYSLRGDISSNFYGIILALVASIAGVNSVNSIKDILIKKKEEIIEPESVEEESTEEK